MSLRFAAMALLWLATTPFASTRWGLPSYTDISAYAVNDYARMNDLSRSIAHKNTFISAIQGQIRSKYPSVSTTVTQNRENSAATFSRFVSSENSSSEFVIFVGHGNKGLSCLYDADVHASDKHFGSWNRWVILDDCLTLNESVGWDNLVPYFDGAHAILGNRAKGWQFYKETCFIWCWDQHYSESEYNHFASKFISEGKTIGDSYLESVGEVINGEGGLGIEPAVFYVEGYADNGQFVSFVNERYQNTYNGAFNGANGANITWYGLVWRTFGTPSY